MTWKEVKLGKYIEILSGFAFEANLFSSEKKGLPIARIRDVKRGYSETYYSGQYDPKYLLQNGDMLIGMDGEFNLAKWQGGSALLNQRVCKIKSCDDTLDPNYLFRFLPRALKAIEDNTPFVTVKHLSVKKIEVIEIPLPPLDDQRRIAAILDQADALRQQRRQVLAALDRLTHSVFLDMFGDPVRNPKEWEVLKFGFFCSEIKYGTNEKSFDTPTSGSIPVIRIPNILNGFIDFSDLKYSVLSEVEKRKCLLHKGDILFVRSNGNPEYIGRCAVFDKTIECVNASYLIRARLKRDAPILSEFIKQVILFPSYRKRVLKEARTTAGNYNLNTQGLKSFEIYCPPLDLQKNFVERLKRSEMATELQQKSYEKLDTLFHSLQQQAFMGELQG